MLVPSQLCVQHTRAVHPVPLSLAMPLRGGRTTSGGRALDQGLPKPNGAVAVVDISDELEEGLCGEDMSLHEVVLQFLGLVYVRLVLLSMSLSIFVVPERLFLLTLTLLLLLVALLPSDERNDR